MTVAEAPAADPSWQAQRAAELADLHALPAHADHWTKLPVVTALAVVVIGVGLLTTLLVSAVGVGLLLIVAALWLQGALDGCPKRPSCPTSASRRSAPACCC